jgi:hypothetical protein
VPSVTILKPSLIPAPTPITHYLCESWWTCHTAPGSRHRYRERLDCILSLTPGLAVIPPAVFERLDLIVRPERGWKGQTPTWFGVPCRIGRVSMWLAVQGTPGPYREFSVLAQLPRRDLEDAPPFISLGTQFLLEYQAELQLNCSSPREEGRLIFP